ncbi:MULTISPECIES: EpsG family protein [Enterobacter]|uniref:EpsG family protein n=1 Tax=Enterobacter TaxID=547 RepID=UPI0032B5FDB4
MFILLQCMPLLFLSLLWPNFKDSLKKIVAYSLVFLLGVAYTAFYLNGEDWVNYYVNFFTREGTAWFEPGFYLLYSCLSFLSHYNFGVTTLLFFLLSFAILTKFVLDNKDCNLPFFLLLLIICFGNTLILEQLRQFASAILALCALITRLNLNRKKSNFYLLLAISFHASAVIVACAFFLASIKNSKIFIFISLSIASFLLLLLTSDSLVNIGVQLLPAIFIKIKVYREITDLSLHVGPSLIFSIVYLLYQLKNIGKLKYTGDYSVVFLKRQLFFGGLIFLVGIFIPFMSRMSTFFIIFLFYDVAINNYFKYFQIGRRVVLKFVLVLFYSFFSLASYFKNDIAPVSFDNLTFNFIPFVLNDINYDSLVYETYFKNALVTSELISDK